MTQLSLKYPQLNGAYGDTGFYGKTSYLNMRVLLHAKDEYMLKTTANLRSNVDTSLTIQTPDLQSCIKAKEYGAPFVAKWS